MSSIEDVERNAWDRVLQLNHGRLSHVPHWIQCTKCDKWRVMNISTSVIKFTKTWKAPPNWQCNRNNTAVNNCTLPVTVPSLCTHSAFAVLVLKTQRKLAAIRAIASNADRSIHIQKLNKVIERYAKEVEAKQSRKNICIDLTGCSDDERIDKSDDGNDNGSACPEQEHKAMAVKSTHSKKVKKQTLTEAEMNEKHSAAPLKKQKPNKFAVSNDEVGIYWSCAVCTYRNQESQTQCEICETDRDSSSNKSKDQSPLESTLNKSRCDGRPGQSKEFKAVVDTLYTQQALKCNEQKHRTISIPLQLYVREFQIFDFIPCEEFRCVIHCVDSRDERLKDIFDAILKYLISQKPGTFIILSSCSYDETPSFVIFTEGVTKEIEKLRVLDFEANTVRQQGLKLSIHRHPETLTTSRFRLKYKCAYRDGAHIQTTYTYTKMATKPEYKSQIIAVHFENEYLINDRENHNCDWWQIIVYCAYAKGEKIKHLLDAITREAETRNFPVKYMIVKIPTAFKDCHSITDYPRSAFATETFEVTCIEKYEHRVTELAISCEHMIEKKSDDALNCPIYKAMKNDYEFKKEYLMHLDEFSHFTNEYEQKPECRYKEECKAYIRGQSGSDRIDDKCHMKLYRHPPRRRNVKLAQNINSLILNTDRIQNHPIFKPPKECKESDYVEQLIDEVIENGYKYDLCLLCKHGDDCKHDEYSILQIVDEKMESMRHQQMCEPLEVHHMLALVLYTGSDCNHDLCASQRGGDYEKWKWFDFCLYRAIQRLSKKEKGAFPVFSGLDGVKMAKKAIKSGYFKTYCSTSWSKDVAKCFIEGEQGMVLEIDEKFKDHGYVYCCDVSWISKFPDECEILFARSLNNGHSKHFNFDCAVLDEADGIQTVSLKRAKK